MIICDTWPRTFSERKWAIEIRETTNNTVRVPHEYTTPMWLEGHLSSSAVLEWHLEGGGGGGLNEILRTRRNFWNVPDQIISPSSEYTTADFLYN